MTENRFSGQCTFSTVFLSHQRVHNQSPTLQWKNMSQVRGLPYMWCCSAALVMHTAFILGAQLPPGDLLMFSRAWSLRSPGLPQGKSAGNSHIFRSIQFIVLGSHWARNEGQIWRDYWKERPKTSFCLGNENIDA